MRHHLQTSVFAVHCFTTFSDVSPSSEASAQTSAQLLTICDDVVLPMPANNVIAYRKGSRDTASHYFKIQASMLNNIPMSSCILLRQMFSMGLKWDSIGIDFSVVQRGWSAGAESFYRGVREIRSLILCPTCYDIFSLDDHGKFNQMQVHAWIPGWWERFVDFRRDGFLMFSDLAVDISRLKSLAKTVFSGARVKCSECIVKPEPTHAPELEPIFANRRILELASLYLGADVQFVGYKFFRVPASVTEDNYLSGQWHHDGCGSRLKLFLFLHDVKTDGTPTAIARGTQNIEHFGAGRTTVRYDNDYVESTYDIAEMTGFAGGGFLFDTNTVHKGKLDGAQRQRDVIIIDIMTTDKLKKASTAAFGPCPEPSTYPAPHTIAAFPPVSAQFASSDEL